MKATIERHHDLECERITITVEIPRRDQMEAPRLPECAVLSPDSIILARNVGMDASCIELDPESITVQLLKAAWVTAWKERYEVQTAAAGS